MTVFTEEESIDAPTENSKRKDCDGRERRGASMGVFGRGSYT